MLNNVNNIVVRWALTICTGIMLLIFVFSQRDQAQAAISNELDATITAGVVDSAIIDVEAEIRKIQERKFQNFTLMQLILGRYFSETQHLRHHILSTNRILCMILNRPNGLAHRQAIMTTWGKRCTKTIFLTGSQRSDNITEATLTECDTSSVQLNCKILQLSVIDEHDATWIKVSFPNIYFGA